MKTLFRILTSAVLAFLLTQGVFANTTSSRDTRQRMFAAMERTMEVNTNQDRDHPLKDLYINMYKDLFRFAEQQTELEFERKYGFTSPQRKQVTLTEEGGIVVGTVPGQTALSIEQSFAKQEEDMAEMYENNLYYSDVLMYAKYKMIFVDGDVSNSGIDLGEDMYKFKEKLVVQQYEFRPLDGLIKQLPNPLEYILGYQRFTADQANQERLAGLVAEAEKDLKIGTGDGDLIGSCSVDTSGYVRSEALSFDSDSDREAFRRQVAENMALVEEQQIITDAFLLGTDQLDLEERADVQADFERLFPDIPVEDLADPASAEERKKALEQAKRDAVEWWHYLLDPGLLSRQIGEAVEEADAYLKKGCSNEICFRLQTFYKVGTPSTFISRPYPMERNLDDLLQIFTHLANKNNKSRTIPRSVFSFPFHLPGGIKPEFNFYVKVVPMFPKLEFSKIYAGDYVDTLATRFDEVFNPVFGSEDDYLRSGQSVTDYLQKVQERTEQRNAQVAALEKTMQISSEVDQMKAFGQVVQKQMEATTGMLQVIRSSMIELAKIAYVLAHKPVVTD